VESVRGHAETDQADRYVTRLTAGFTASAETSTVPSGMRPAVAESRAGTLLHFPGRTTTLLSPTPERLIVRIDAADPASMQSVQEMICSQLERLAPPDEVRLTWDDRTSA